MSTDAENVYTILSARLMQPSLYVIGRAESDESSRKLKKAGADRVMSPYQIGGLHMAQLALRPAVVEFVQLATSSEFMELSMEQILVRAGGPLVGPTIIGANLRQNFGVIVIGIRRTAGQMEFAAVPGREDGGGRLPRGPRQERPAHRSCAILRRDGARRLRRRSNRRDRRPRQIQFSQHARTSSLPTPHTTPWGSSPRRCRAGCPSRPRRAARRTLPGP